MATASRTATKARKASQEAASAAATRKAEKAPAVPMVPVKSSMFTRMGGKASKGKAGFSTVCVEFNNGKVVSYTIPTATWQRWQKASSKGKFYHAEIARQYGAGAVAARRFHDDPEAREAMAEKDPEGLARLERAPYYKATREALTAAARAASRARSKRA